MNDKQRKAKAYLSSYLVLVSQAERAYEDYERDRLPRLYTARSDVIAAVAERNQLWGEVLEMVHVEGMRICDVRRFIEHDRRHAISEGAVYKLYYRALEKAFDEMERLGAKPSDGAPPQP